jgi:hypothetical protein
MAGERSAKYRQEIQQVSFVFFPLYHSICMKNEAGPDVGCATALLLLIPNLAIPVIFMAWASVLGSGSTAGRCQMQ